MVRHANDFLYRYRPRVGERGLKARNVKLLRWVTDHVLASMVMFDLALVIPLLALDGPHWFQTTVMILSSNWIQLWALPALQRSQNDLQARQQAKADADHETLTQVMEILARLDGGRL